MAACATDPVTGQPIAGSTEPRRCDRRDRRRHRRRLRRRPGYPQRLRRRRCWRARRRKRRPLHGRPGRRHAPQGCCARHRHPGARATTSSSSLPSDITFARAGPRSSRASFDARHRLRVAEPLSEDDDRHRRPLRPKVRTRPTSTSPIAAPKRCRAYLAGKAVLSARMATGGVGEAQPVVFPDDTEAKRSQNPPRGDHAASGHGLS